MVDTEFDLISQMPESDRALLRLTTSQISYVPAFASLVAIAKNADYAECLRGHFARHSSSDCPILITHR